MNSFDTGHASAHDQNDATLVNLAEHRKPTAARFPDVEDLLERLTDDTVSVANGDYRPR